MLEYKMMGIYTIKNMVTNQLYIGSAINFNKRFKSHKVPLKKGTHPNSKLQNSWNKYGEQAFRFQPEELVEDKNDLISTEQQWLNVLWNEFDLFNICPIAGSSLGRVCSEETKQKMRQPRSEEHKKNISLAKIGKNHPMFGKCHKDKTRQKMSIAQRNKRLTEETKQKIRIARTGKHHTEETKNKISLSEIKSKNKENKIYV